MLLTFVLALFLMTATLYALRGGLYTTNGLQIVGGDVEGIGIGLFSVLIAAWFFGPLYGLALILSVMIHEFGHVAAFRVAGHEDARFRLIPLMGGVAISDRAPDTQLEDFFISLAGPAICLAPMVLAFAAADLLAPVSPVLAEFFWIFATTTAALNALNLLPFWPLDGGHCLRAVAYAIHPRAATVATMAMSAAFAATAIALHSLLLFFVALLGTQSIFRAEKLSRVQQPMSGREAVLALAAYLFTAGAHLAGGIYLIAAYL